MDLEMHMVIALLSLPPLMTFSHQHNSAFCHPSRHILTWHGTFLNQDNQQNQDYHNQIYYVLCRIDDKETLLNARSYRGFIARTDHGVVVTTIDLSKYHSRIQPLQKQKPHQKR